MKSSIIVSETIGKTVKDYCFSYRDDSIILAFDDGSFIEFYIDNIDEEISFSLDNVNPLRYSPEFLDKYGIYTANERAYVLAEEKAVADKLEYDKYLELKEKYEPKEYVDVSVTRSGDNIEITEIE